MSSIICNDLVIDICCYIDTATMLNLSRTCKKYYVMILNSERNMIHKKFSIKKEIKNLNFIQKLSYKIYNLDISQIENSHENLKYMQDIHTLYISDYKYSDICEDQDMHRNIGIYISNNKERNIYNEIKDLKNIHTIYIKSYIFEITNRTFQHCINLKNLNIDCITLIIRDGKSISKNIKIHNCKKLILLD